MTPGEQLVQETSFHWHQRFEVEPGVFTPGTSDVAWLMHVAEMPEDVTGWSVLDVGTANGGTAFELERRGATRIVATDITPMGHCGFDRIRDVVGSSAEFIQTTIYELPEILSGEQFDLVVFWGVLYHLRHPLLALDSLRRLTRGTALIETAVCDNELPRDAKGLPVSAFYRRGELNGDVSNWFAPSVKTLLDWCNSSGFDATLLDAWPKPERRFRTAASDDTSAAVRAMVRVEPRQGDPEYRDVSWAEGPFSVTSLQWPFRDDALAALSDNPTAAALIFDVDGTLAPIVARPENASVPEATRAELRRLAGRYALVACVSGRTADDARNVVGIPELTYIGEHGLGLDAAAGDWGERIRAFAGGAGWPAEVKSFSATFHFRTAEDQAAARAQLERIEADARAQGFRTRWGRLSLEVLPPIEASKRTAVAHLLEQHGLRLALYAGDDTTDLDAFAALDDLDAGVRVAVASNESPPDLRERADVVVPSPEKLVELLKKL